MNLKKRKQHYVWQHYLEAWTNNGQLYCLRNKSIFPTNTLNVGQQRDFYRLQELTPNDITLIKLLYVNTSPLFLQPLHNQLLDGFNLAFELKRLYEESGKKDEEFEKQIDITINNLEENLHCGIEKMAIPFLEEVRKKDLSFYDDEQNKIEFNYFVATQYLRTNHMRQRLKQAFQDMPAKYAHFNFDINKVWNVVSHIMATNLGYSLSRPDYHINIFLLENNTDIPFITCDQPLINIKSNPTNFEVPSELELYYPQTPQIALMFSMNDTISFSKNVSKDEVKALNDLMVSSSQEQIYANEKSVLEQYL